MNYLDRLNPRQREAVEITEGPLMVIAGAGSGKTSMLTSRIAHLILERGVSPHQILAVTFTNKAAEEMRTRVYQILDPGSTAPMPWRSNRPEVGTFHSVCVRILRNELPATPFTRPFVIYDDSDQLVLVKNVMKILDLDPKQTNPKAMQAGINRLKCDGTEPHEYVPSDFNAYEKKLKTVYETYQQELFRNQALDFGEILCMTYRIFKNNESILRKYQTRFSHIHVDEYQDTNRAQYLLLSLLAQKQFGGHENICVVGDEDQSIYKWRGADIRNILEFERDYPSAKIVKLEQNYRSTQTIIEASSRLISHNTERKPKTLWTENERGEPILRVQLPDERQEAEFVVQDLQRQAATNGYGFDDFAIFYRTHAQSRQFEDVLRREKTQYQVFGGIRFYDRKEIKDVLAYFRVIQNPMDSVSLKRIINVPGRGIGKTTVDKLEDRVIEANRVAEPGLFEQKSVSLWEVLGQASGLGSAASSKLGAFRAMIEKLQKRRLDKIPLSELYHELLDATGYVTELKKEGTIEAQSRVEVLQEFETALQEFEEEISEEGSEADLLDLFLERVTLDNEAATQVGISAVKLMTYHAAKGLEFPVVYMVGLEDGLFPATRPWEETDPSEFEEERRLCYVGMTRAKRRLVMTHAVSRRIWGEFHYQQPASFFKEIPEDSIQFMDFVKPLQQMQRRAHEIMNDDSENDDVPYEFDSGRVGSRIQHPQYGRGKIIASEGSGDDEKVVIEFDGRMKRKFLFRFVHSFVVQ